MGWGGIPSVNVGRRSFNIGVWRHSFCSGEEALLLFHWGRRSLFWGGGGSSFFPAGEEAFLLPVIFESFCRDTKYVSTEDDLYLSLDDDLNLSLDEDLHLSRPGSIFQTRI